MITCNYRTSSILKFRQTSRRNVNFTRMRQGNDNDLAMVSEFWQKANELNIKEPMRDRKPSPLMSPSATIEAQMYALQMNDWPEPDSGITTAFEFCKPQNLEESVQHIDTRKVRQWAAFEEFLNLKGFLQMMQELPYNVLINCSQWQSKSQVIFTNKSGNKAVQAIQVTSNQSRQEFTFTFCMEKILQGPYKDCWLTVGVRVGDYASI
eukprot:TRINITY_DN2606_c0_g1_i10.p3 TRINITY_DN2606_c0_g1~~TRINITY_DN2606_c0_g1_i10.p3  ORF type:complete len:208 (-),score=13.12 TRINITY_DN2606_c0_g1_i10:210-833(-)